ncbi:MAG: hypothetical protein HOM59_01795 [Candidatus Marinimicrobia bacterium]|nr:hypothetical protein [Candidatus Neomarinimicrobiota bacterium]
MALSLKYNDLLDIGHSIRDIAEYEGVDKSYILRIVKMVYLSPKIQEKIALYLWTILSIIALYLW